MEFLRSFSRLSGWRLPATLALFLSLALSLHAQQIPVSAAAKKPGSEVSIHADSQQKDKNTYHLRGHVNIVYEDMHVTADEASFDDTSGDVMARGHVVFDDPKSHLLAEEVHYNIRTQKGWFSNGAGYLHSKGTPRPRVLKTQNPFYIWGDTVDRLDEDTYLVDRGSMTTCECAKEGWLLSVQHAKVTVNDKLVAHHAVFRFLGIPIFYFPFLVDSIAKEPRQTGFLLPHVGNSSQKGYIVGDGFFWAINPSADLMFGVEEYSKRGLAERGEFRAKPSQNAEFVINYFGINDKYSGVTSQYNNATGQYTTVSLAAPGESIHGYGKDDDIGGGFRAVANIDYVNTMAFRLTWSPNYTEAVSSEALQSGFVTKNWDAYSFNVSAERYENFLSTELVPGNAVIIRHLPSFQFAGADRQIGDSPVYFSFETSVDAVGRTTPGVTLPLLEDRLDFHPQLLLRPKEFWHFRFTPMLGFRATHYGASLEANHSPVDRVLAEVGLDLRPPSLEKVFAKPYRGYRLKHVIEPDIQYHLVRARDPENIMDVIRFDAMDIFTQTNEVEYSLTNTILARKDVPDNSPDMPQARDIFSWRISQKYYLDPTFGNALIAGQNNVFASTIDLTGFAFEHGQRFSPIDSVFKFAPFSNYDTEIRTDMNPSGAGGVLDAGISSRVKRGLLGITFTDFFINHTSYLGSLLASATAGLPSTSPTPLTAFNLLGSLVTYGDPNRKGLSGAFGIDYNFQQKIVQHVVTQLSYNFGCFGIDIEYQNFDLGPLRRESQFRVALALANVGTFGNLKPRERLY
ncbi:MAG: putative LPS assembly protein LptD [Acidobacteriota bacterium]|nr:putative LPS assembly protein LptD [Acidobacteriota bacterium]